MRDVNWTYLVSEPYLPDWCVVSRASNVNLCKLVVILASTAEHWLMGFQYIVRQRWDIPHQNVCAWAKNGRASDRKPGLANFLSRSPCFQFLIPTSEGDKCFLSLLGTVEFFDGSKMGKTVVELTMLAALIWKTKRHSFVFSFSGRLVFIVEHWGYLSFFRRKRQTFPCVPGVIQLSKR